MSNLPMLFTPVQVAKILNVSRSKVFILLKEEKLKSIKIGYSRRITSDQIQEFIDSLKPVD